MPSPDKSRVRIYIDMDDVLCEYAPAMNRARFENPDIKFPQSMYGFYINLKPVEGACEAFHLLDRDYDVWILTRPSVKNPLCYTEKRVWVEKHLGIEACNKLIICPDKALLKGDYLIDDVDWKDFDGTQIHFGSTDFPDWKAVLKRFIYSS